MDDLDTLPLPPAPPSPPEPPPPALTPAEEDAAIRELGQLRVDHSEMVKRINHLSALLGGRRHVDERPSWGPCTRCGLTWKGRWPYTAPRTCPQCGSTGWRVSPGNKKNARHPNDPPNQRWYRRKRKAGQKAAPTKPKVAAPRTVDAFSVAGVEEMFLPPPPKPPSLVPSQSVRFADPGLEAPQPERTVSRSFTVEPGESVTEKAGQAMAEMAQELYSEEPVALGEGDGIVRPESEDEE